MGKKPLLATVSLAILAILLFIPAHDTYTDEGDDYPQYPVPGKAEPRYPNLGSGLNQLVANFEPGQAVEKAADNAAVHNAGMVAVTIYLSGETDVVVAFLEDNGGSPRNVGEDYIEAHVPATLLGQVSEQPGVIRIREIIPPQQAAHVAGTAALMRQGFPHLTAAQVASYLKDNAEQRGSPDPNNTWGHGFAKLPLSTPAATCLTGGAVADTANNRGLAADCELLLAAKDTLAGTQGMYWFAFVPIDQWIGVTVAGTPPRVTGLNLGEQRLTGQVPAELGNLSNLQELSLGGNQLTGTIPPELARLTNLELLALSHNQLSGPVPSALSSLTSLEVLDLSQNQLTGCVPGSLRDVADNDFAELELPFCASQDPLITLYDAMADRAVLVALYNATGGPNWNSNNNWLSDVPISEWSGVTTDDNGRVTELYLRQNQLTGPIPSALSSLTSLEVLSLGNNQLTGPIPPALGNLSNLQGLYLWGNQLSGPIPAELGNLTSLQWLYLSGNQLTGPIPAELGNLSNLQALDLFGNQLTGPIPAELGNLTSLQWLDLWGNQLTGPIPAELGNLTSLEVLYLSQNQLTGCVPGSLRDVAYNDFAELELPFCASQDPLITLYDAMADRAALVALYNATGGPNWNSNNNWLSDVPISEWSGVTTDDNGRVTELDLSQNQLTGPIPPALGNLSNLQGLGLWGNQLTGPIPAELGNLSNLQELGLSGNQLSGPIPAELGNLSNLQELGLSGNQLSGPIPAELGNLSNLQELGLSGNQLTGPIPAELGNLTSLQWLYLSGNQLTGPIPAELGNLSNLQELSLFGNQLTGPIPASLGNLTSLEVLYLSQNQLTGCVPGSLRDVADNDFAELELPFCASQDPLITLYDANGDRAIDISELFSAIDDYFAGRIDISQLFGVIELYFSGPTPTPRPT